MNNANVWIMSWASYQIRKIAVCACAWNATKRFPRHQLQRQLLVSDPGMHHGTCITHMSSRRSGALILGGRKNVPGISGACAIRNFTDLVRGPLWKFFIKLLQPHRKVRFSSHLDVINILNSSKCTFSLYMVRPCSSMKNLDDKNFALCRNENENSK